MEKHYIPLIYQKYLSSKEPQTKHSSEEFYRIHWNGKALAFLLLLK